MTKPRRFPTVVALEPRGPAFHRTSVADLHHYPDDYGPEPPCPWCGEPCPDDVCSCDLDGMGAHPGLSRAHRIRRVPGTSGFGPTSTFETRRVFRPRRYGKSFRTLPDPT